MPDLASALESLFDGGDMTIVQAQVSAVGTGVATVILNGGDFTDVPYMIANYGGGTVAPAVNQKVYVIARKNWGMLIIGAPAPGPSRSVGGGTTVLWPPAVLAEYSPISGAWTVSGDDQLSCAYSIWSAEIFTATDRPTMPTTGLAAAWFSINLISAESSGSAGGGAYLNIGLFTNTGPSGVLTPAAGTTEQTVYLSVHEVRLQSIPLDWGNRLMAGTAHGIYVRAEADFDLNQITLGELRLSFL